MSVMSVLQTDKLCLTSVLQIDMTIVKSVGGVHSLSSPVAEQSPGEKRHAANTTGAVTAPTTEQPRSRLWPAFTGASPDAAAILERRVLWR